MFGGSVGVSYFPKHLHNKFTEHYQRAVKVG